jgi:protein TonB
MEHAMGVRATSFAAAAGVMSVAAIAALTATFSNFILPMPPAPAPIDMMPPIEPPAPPPVTPQTQAAPPVDAPFAPTDMTYDEMARVEEISTEPVVGGPNLGPPMISDPHWTRRPRDLARYYPRRAMERGVEGQVVLDCLVATTGRLSCVVVSETPQNWGFAEAALRISRDYQMVPATRNGAPVVGRYRMVAPFRLE